MLVEIEPRSKRARERVRQHGGVMRLVRETPFDGISAVLVESLGETFRCGGENHVWTGWLTEREAIWSKA